MSGVVKRSVSIRGHRTSFSLEEPFLCELASIAKARDVSLAALVAEIDALRPRNSNLSSALRLFVLEAARQKGSDGPRGGRGREPVPARLSAVPD